MKRTYALITSERWLARLVRLLAARNRWEPSPRFSHKSKRAAGKNVLLDRLCERANLKVTRRL